MLEQSFTEIPTKKCLYAIPGLASRSFEFSNEDQANTIQKLFANSPVWIQQRSTSVEELKSQVDKCSKLMEISFGYLASTTVYYWSQKIQNNYALAWKTDIHHKCLSITYKTNKEIQLRINQDCLDKYFIIPFARIKTYTMILPLKASPRCYHILQHRKGRCDKRQLDFEIINGSCLANSSALCLTFLTYDALVTCAEFLGNTMKLDCYHGHIECIKMPVQALQFDHILSDFWSNYAFQMLLTLGDRIKNRITSDTILKIMKLSYLSHGQQYPNHQCYLKLTAVYYRARYNCFFDINQEYDNIQPLPSSIVLDKWEYIPRIYLTPYGVYPLPVKPMRGNRILRERNLFGPGEKFCRVIIRDVDLGQPQKDFMQINEQWIKHLIIGKNPIMVGDQSFEFLLCSNSQLRDRSFWFHAPYKNNRATHIRAWMGDFSSEQCIGTRIARMALSLTGTTATIKLLSHEIEIIDDKFDDHNRIFTDGTGKISPMALEKALKIYNPELIEDNYMPCVIQARLNGIKGVFVIAPDLNERGVLIQYRRSQYKFKVDHNVLEIVKHSSSGTLFLNRQVITLLENMGVKQETFIKLQNKTRKKISMSLLANKTAQHTLEQNVRSYDWERMRQSGVQLTQEPFVRSLLLLLAQERLKRLKEKSQVRIPLSDGRMLIGVVDETNSLEYGQVFIKLRDLNGQSQIIQNRKILITKNPAHFPGDIRKLDAVDCPALHHLYECVVFPAQGQRPHPNEISGSDTDGDEYWVCWNEELVNNATIQHPPATFDATEKVKHNGEITMMDNADFLFKFLSSDSLGALSNRHLACCAIYGASHEDSCRLAQIISESVDFPKTGVLPKCPKDINVNQYPDFMENKYKESFVSNSSIGIMYRQVKQAWEMHLAEQDKLNNKTINMDKNFLINGYKKYIHQAENEYEYYSSRINTILATYNLENESELITGCHSCIEEEKKNNDSVETALLEFRYLNQEMRARFESDELNYIEQLRKTSAYYYVAYTKGTILSFGWIMNRLMSDIIKQKQIVQEEHQALKHIAIDRSYLPMENNKSSKQKCCTPYRWTILILMFILIPVIILTIIFVIQAKHDSQPSVINTLNTTIINQKYNISIKGLLTMDVAAKTNICDKSETIEDCVLLYNAKLFMNALLLVPSSASNHSIVSFSFPENSTKSTIACKTLKIRRNQLAQIFDPITLETIFNLSGIRYSSVDDTISSDSTQSRSQIDGRSIKNRWSTPINYYISKTTGLTSSMIANIRIAISNWENNTCLIFNELSVITSTTNTSYVLFERDDEYGCSSPVGYDKTDPTSVILISSYCGAIIGSIMHEIGHTLGYIHTQSRVDRNSYVSIATSNIQEDFAGNFFIWIFGTIRFSDVTFPYDYGSFMHYDSYAFSKNNEPTIIPYESRYEKTMGQRERAAFYDYKQMNRLYYCPLMFSNNACQNNGYLDPNTCSYCICPEGFSGTYCDQKDSNSNCGDTIINLNPYFSTQITIQNPSPTTIIPTEQYCVYLIRIRLRLDSINTVKRSVCSLRSLIEVKYQKDLALTGARWCGNTITSDWLNITAETNTMIVIFRANNSINITTGNPQASFRATIFFDAEPIPVVNLTTVTTTTTTTISSTASTIQVTNSLTTTGTTLSTCPPSSFRCQLPSQPTCGGCLNYQPCIIEGTQPCLAYTYQIQLTDCDKIVNGVAQCRYQFIQTQYTTSCPRTVLLCCPNYQLISIQTYYFCVYNPQASNLPSEWSLII
ncbi:unnamed protein product [Rotaria sp. Silwood1]|nr:unnamed protein product [Rotaria sp. Silwood1]